MTCSKCTKLPIINYKNCIVYLVVNVDHLYDKVDDVLARLKYKYVKNLNFYEINVDDFQNFISYLLMNGSFS